MDFSGFVKGKWVEKENLVDNMFIHYKIIQLLHYIWKILTNDILLG